MTTPVGTQLTFNSTPTEISAAASEAQEPIATTAGVTSEAQEDVLAKESLPMQHEFLLPVEEDVAYTEQQMRSLEMNFETEAYDVQWAPVEEEAVWNDFEQAHLDNSHLASVDCRTSTCRIEVMHIDAAAESEFMVALMQQANVRSGSIHRIHNEDSLATLIYTSR
ncbi:hypothetical protein [Halioxenophilus aromaticivorans]|uniref:Uncharacterized protein n=1 Tax=Halioxenophilus aromaticivorans TaxID=1306992 RepID=A0AAV3U231_9ALTE